MKTIRHITVAFAVSLFLIPAALAQQVNPPGLDRRAARVVTSPPGQALTGTSRAAHASIVADFVRGRGASAATVSTIRQLGTASVARNGVTHVRLEQQVGGLSVHGAYARAAFKAQGQLVHLVDHLAAVPAGGAAAAIIDEQQALSAAMASVHPGVQANVRRGTANGNTVNFSGDAFFYANPAVTRVAIPMSDGSLAVGFLVETWTKDKNLLHHTVVSGSGQVLSVELRTANDSYNVFVEDPSKGPQTIVTGPPVGPGPSPLGWLSSGPQSTINISGNNVNAYLDTVANNKPDTGGSIVTSGNFTTAANLLQSPSTAGNRAVGVQNLFYFNNVAHDVLYGHGFNEAAGNFQNNNFNLGGTDSDSVLAEAQDGGGTDNANFSTPTDGRKPRMQMYLWTGNGPTHLVHVNAPAPAIHDYGARDAAFGPALTTTGITGPVALAVDAVAPTEDACEGAGSGVNGKIALLDRGTCDFTVKVLNAQNAGAIGVIVVNNIGTTEVIPMGGTQKRIRIPAVMVSHDDGAVLRGLVGSGLNVTLRRNPTQPLQIDGDIDADIVFHEYGHGLTWRMIGGMSGPLAGAIGEGASDVVAFLINGDDRIGEYSAGDPRGIRRDPYSGYPRTYGDVTGAEVHDDGEIYAAAMWRLAELFDGAGISRNALFDYFVDGMNYTASTPAFENMRDGMLESIANGPHPEHRCLVWQAFAQLGIGVGASGVPSGANVTITESFALPPDCL